ncbi:unnamed protein product [Rhizophagus irregularis]|nr:unnamed protein product [Rhizophagus irregularis]
MVLILAMIWDFGNGLEFQQWFGISAMVWDFGVGDNAFGRLKNRFKALKELNSRKISNVVQLTECAIILHNFLELNNDNIEELFEDNDNENDENDEENEENQNEIALKREGERKREYIINQIIDP